MPVAFRVRKVAYDAAVKRCGSKAALVDKLRVAIERYGQPPADPRINTGGPPRVIPPRPEVQPRFKKGND